MNVFRLLLFAIIGIALLYLIITQFGPLFSPETNLRNVSESLLNEAQADLGQNKGIGLKLKEGQSLYARNLDSLTRTVAFACSTPDCCPQMEGCTKSISVTSDRLAVHTPVDSGLTARCVEVNQIHACKLYFGREPAQLILEGNPPPSEITIQGVDELIIPATIRNGGEVPATNVTIRVEMIEDQIIAGVPIPTIIEQDEKIIESISPDKSIPVELRVELQRIGTFMLRLRAEGMDAGTAEKEYALNVKGSEEDLCKRDLINKEAAHFDAFENVCRKKVFCMGCIYTFECRQIWEKESPLTGNGNPHYDPNQGEPGFTFQLWSSPSGTC